MYLNEWRIAMKHPHGGARMLEPLMGYHVWALFGGYPEELRR